MKEEKRRRDDVLSFVIREEARTTVVYKPKAAATRLLTNFLKAQLLLLTLLFSQHIFPRDFEICHHSWQQLFCEIFVFIYNFNSINIF